MATQLVMVGIVVANMTKSLEFYRRLGVSAPQGDAGGAPHVEIKMDNGLVFFLDTAEFARFYDPDRLTPSGGSRVTLEFLLGSPEEVDAKYTNMAIYGYTGHRPPFDTPFGARFAMVDDPDGNTILISALLTK
jgi:uncharacterized glyoxalase superfamily protein PhnB